MAKSDERTILKEVFYMASYGIMRIEKQGRSAIYGLQIEANRTIQDHQQGRDFDNSDIDWTKTKDNIHIIHTVNWNREVTRQIKEAGLKERKDSIVLLDALYTASPEWFETHTRREMLEYFRDCLHFHIREYCAGDKSKLVNAVIHLDEKTPHLHVSSIPIIEDEKGAHLSAKIIMGNKDDYRLRQDRFYSEVSSCYGMERGEPKRPEEIKKHTTKREWQTAQQESKIDNLQTQKELLEFDVSSLTASRRYADRKAEEAKQKRKEIENEVNTLLEKQNNLQECHSKNVEYVNNWANQAVEKIKKANAKIAEYEECANDVERQFMAELEEAVLQTLGDIPEPPEIDFEAPVAQFTNYDEEEYEL